MKKTNLLVLTRGLFIGGAELVIGNLCKHLDKFRFKVSVCYLKLNGPVGHELKQRGFEVFQLPSHKRKLYNYFSFIHLLRVIKENRIKIVHTHDTASLAVAALSKLLYPNLKIVHTFHFGNYPHLCHNNLRLEKLFCRIPDKLIAVGHEQKRAILKTFNLNSNRVATVWNGITEAADPADPAFFERYKRNGAIVIGSLSTLIEQKGLTYLLDVAHEIKKRKINAIFWIVGDGKLKFELQTKCEKFGLKDFVFFLGWIENAASTVLPIFDIFFQPSLWEAMSMVLLEAMIIGKPVVVTAVGENIHIIQHGENGYLVEPKDVTAMANNLEKLIGDSNLRKQFGLSARKIVKQKFTADKMAKNYEKIYQAL